MFGYGTPPFTTLNGEFRRRVIEEAAAARPRLIFTFVWSSTIPPTPRGTRPRRAVRGRRVQVLVVELSAGLATRLERNRGEDRIAAKPPKRNVDWSEANVRELDAAHVMNTDPGRPAPADAVLAGLAHPRPTTPPCRPRRPPSASWPGLPTSTDRFPAPDSCGLPR